MAVIKMMKRTTLYCYFLLAAPVAVAGVIPPGFESLALEHEEYLSVMLEGQVCGVVPVRVSPDTLTFSSPASLPEALFSGMSDSGRKRLSARLARSFPRHDTGYSLAPDEEAGLVYNEDAQSVMLVISPALLNTHERLYYSASREGVSRAFVSQQSMFVSQYMADKHISGSGHWAQGLGARSYLAGDWTVTQSRNAEGQTRSRFSTGDLLLRRDMSDTLYVQGGYMDNAGLGDHEGGAFPLSLLTVPRIAGFRTGSTEAYLNTAVAEQSGSPLTVVLTQPARIDIYQGDRLLGTRYEDAGVRSLDTRGLPAGAYPVTLKIYQGGQMVREETQYFRNFSADNDLPRTLQWFFQGGKAAEENGPGNSPASSRTEIAGGIRHRIFPGAGWTVAVQQYEGHTLTGNDLTWHLPFFTHEVSLTGSILSASKQTVADQEQVSWSGRNTSLTLSHYRAHHDSAGMDTRYRSDSASLGMSCGRWAMMLGATHSRNAGRYYRLPSRGLETNFTTPENDRYGASASDLMLSLVRSFRYQDIDIQPHFGFSEHISNGRHDHITFFSVSLSRYQSLSAGLRSNSRVNLNAGGGQTTPLGLEQRWSWLGENEHSLGLSVSAGHTRQSGRVDGDWEGPAGYAGLALSADRDHLKTVTGLSGQYSSTFALTTDGFYPGYGGGDQSQLAGMVMDTRTPEADGVTGPVAKINGGGSPVYLMPSQRLFLPLAHYTGDDVEISGVSRRGANGTLTTGEGTHRLFLLPGHVSRTALQARATYLYTGRLMLASGRPLAGGSILNTNVPDAGSDGSFVAEFSRAPAALYVLKGGALYACPVHFNAGFNGIRHAGTVTCTDIPVSALPATVKGSRRTTLMLSMLQANTNQYRG